MMWDEITYPFQNFNSVTLKFGNEWVISPHTSSYTLLDTVLIIHAWIKVKPC